jgi:hypothetical protein
MKDERDFAAQVDAIENFVTQKYDDIGSLLEVVLNYTYT